MTEQLRDRLNLILPKVTNHSFLGGQGIGNEIACYIFDYAAASELVVREHLAFMMKRCESHHPGLRVLHLDLLDVVIDHLKHRKFYDKMFTLRERKGDAALLKALAGPLTGDKIRDAIAKAHDLPSFDLVLLSGVGSIWPMMRVHGLLNCLHTVMGTTPLVMFYPGTFDGMSLKLFGRITGTARGPGAKHYYRAFPLIPRESSPC